MAATDQTYRNQRALDIVFAVSCILMLLSVIWMFVQDYNREYKAVQREFRDVEEARNERLMLEQLPDPQLVAQKRQAVTDARKALKEAKAQVAPVERELMVRHEAQDSSYRAIKADYDSKMSYYNIEIEHLGESEPGSARYEHLQQSVKAKEEELRDLKKRLDAAQDALDTTDREFKEKVLAKLAGPEGQVAQAEDDLKKTTETFDRFAKATAQRTWKFGDTFRTLPIIDAFESPTKIKQVWLPDLTIDYGGFKDVPRYDRCVTCHLGIERSTFDRAALTALTAAPQELETKLQDARSMLLEREKAGENLGFDPGDLPKKVRAVKLTKGQITQYAAHPRLDLFVDQNSAHPVEKFGCTSCHAGQGSATDFLLAAHSPADAAQEHEWKHNYGWSASHFWDFPMLSSRFVESSCIKCHYQMTDLIRHGSKEEAPKLLRGYNLVREFGCFGCHEIPGVKGGREVGPDLRAEPSPALEYLTAAEQDKARSDPLNPPGALRKVGPSLRRIAEKTNQEWTRKWILAPREFRPDTKMPHFYGLSNNDAEGLADTDQKTFPATEIHSIAYYLFAESQGHLKGADSTRLFLEGRLKDLQNKLKGNILEERDRKELQETSRRLGDLALLSVPARAKEINSYLTQLKQVQERLQELHRKAQQLQSKPEPEELSGQEKKSLEEGKKELDAVTEHLVKAARPTPFVKEIRGEDGTVVSLPESPRDEKARQQHRDNGRRLLTEKGCLACHSHDGALVQGKAHFGPNLSRVAAKIKPEAAAGDDNAARRWLVQWLLNPSIYHPRTRMPITHLKVQDAGDIAEFLLGQKVEGWETQDPQAPATGDLVRLARVYLGKAPGFTRQEVDEYLPDPDKGAPKAIPAERLANTTADSDERRLAEMTDDNLKWYIGRKAISRLGCFGCHDVPGFEAAKPIGTTLNDWGKKDAERLAFEDVAIYAREKYHVVPARRTKKEIEARLAELTEKEGQDGLRADQKQEVEELQKELAEPWESKDGKRPYEEIFFQALEHHHREGFLHQKLMEPRSYDYHRLRTWDDRLRMPKFQFSWSPKEKDESDEEYEARREKEEAEAREAVMTFILGLIAEPTPLKYVYAPNADKLAEIKGRQVLDKFNCAGCHQVRPGVYDFKPTDEAVKLLQDSYDAAKGTFAADHVFMGHNAWVGTPPTSQDRMTVYATEPRTETIDDQELFVVRLADALRFTGNDKVERDLPAGTFARLAPKTLTARAEPFGGTFADLLVPYLKDRYQDLNTPDKARSALPPPLHREGERVQPHWLHQFLLNPGPIRPEGYMKLRMPKFNMSEEDATQLVGYFGAVAKLNNPGAGVTYPFPGEVGADDQYWRDRTAEYVARLKKEKKYDQRVKELEPLWAEYLKKELALAEASVDGAKRTVAEAEKAKDADLPRHKQALEALQAKVKKLKGQVEKKDYSDLKKRWETEDAYAVDAFRLVAGKAICMQCHDVGGMKTGSPIGPNLALARDRLRPDWTREWIANPNRLFTYSPNMPQNFAGGSVQWQELFVGPPAEQVRAARDVLMNLPRLADLPGNQSAMPAPAGGGK